MYRDDDHDGIADVEQMDSKELFRRKMRLMLVHAKKPEEITSAVGSLYTAWLAVLATLKVQFAKTLALGNAIGNALCNPVAILAVPALSHALPKEYHHWIQTVISAVCKIVAVAIAYKVQQVLSAVHSAVRGGLLFSRSIIQWTNLHGWTQVDMSKT